MKTSQTLILIFLGMILGSGAWAEYRAYEVEVFDLALIHISEPTRRVFR